MWELVSLYLHLEDAQGAQEAVRQAAEERGESPARVVRLMAETLRQGEQAEKVKDLRRAFPQHFGGSGR